MGLCCTEDVVRRELLQRGWSIGRVDRAGVDVELHADAGGIPLRALCCTHLAVPDAPSARPCNSAFLRIDFGQSARPPERWAVWTVARADPAQKEPLAIQVSASSEGGTIASAWACQPGESPHPAALLMERTDHLLRELRNAGDVPALIGSDPIWAVEEWSARWSPLGRDHAQMAVGVLATSVLAWPIWKLMDAPDGAIAWLLSVGFTGAGLMAASRIHRAVSLPSRQAGELFGRLKDTGRFLEVRAPRVAEALSLPVAAAHATQRVLDRASIASTLLFARPSPDRGEKIRMALRTISWPLSTVVTSRVLPKSWLALEIQGPDSSLDDLPSWCRSERSVDAAHTVLSAEQLDRWDGRV